MGTMIEVEITECLKHSMKCKIINDQLNLPVRKVEFKQGQVSGVRVQYDSNNNNKNDSSSCCDSDSCEDCNDEHDHHHEQKHQSSTDYTAADSGCCSGNGADGGVCCSSSKSSNKFDVKSDNQNNGFIESKNRLREYAYAALIAGSVVLASRIVLRFLYANK
jgi:hypothetical protein